jgi:hypothetical protein
MKLHITWKYFFAFIAFTFLMYETHELVHTAVGRLLCGCWGQRDFNVWDVCSDCAHSVKITSIATFAGPVYTFILTWIGAFLIKNNSPGKKSFGFALVFANIPLGRIATALMKGGDEVFGLKIIFHNVNTHLSPWIMGLSFVLLGALPPLFISYLALPKKRRVLYFLGFFTLPLFFAASIIVGLMNFILKSGVLTQYWILGSPVLVTCWTIFILAINVFTCKYLFGLFSRGDLKPL